MSTPKTPFSRASRGWADIELIPLARNGSRRIADPRTPTTIEERVRQRRSRSRSHGDLHSRRVRASRPDYPGAEVSRSERTHANRITPNRHDSPGKSDFQAKRRAKNKLRRAGLLVVLLAGAVLVYLVLATFLIATADERVQTPEREWVPEPPHDSVDEDLVVESADSPSDTDRGWFTAVESDPSPNLAAPGEAMRFEGRVALTFDDGPTPDVTPAILDILREHDLRATFFVLGRNVAENPDLLRRIVREGHTLGNHTYTHADLSTLTPEQMHSELQKTQEAVDEALGYHYPVTLMRPPYGEPYFHGQAALPHFEGIMRERRMYPVMWTMDSNDLQSPRAGLIVHGVKEAETILDKEGNDGVLLMHDLHRATVKALPLIIAYYKETGFEFTGARELLGDKYSVAPTDIQADPQGR